MLLFDFILQLKQFLTNIQEDTKEINKLEDARLASKQKKPKTEKRKPKPIIRRQRSNSQSSSTSSSDSLSPVTKRLTRQRRIPNKYNTRSKNKDLPKGSDDDSLEAQTGYNLRQREGKRHFFDDDNSSDDESDYCE